MRVISGKFRGKTLPSPVGEGARPTLDRVKESLFNILFERFENSSCLDLFAGSGGIGIECLSRNASYVCFCDLEFKNLQNIKHTLQKYQVNYELLNCHYMDALTMLNKNNKKFDFIYLDPPFKTDFAIKAIQKIKMLGLLKKDGVIIWEKERASQAEQAVPLPYKIFDSRDYGTINLTFLK